MIVFASGVVAYVVFVLTALYAIGFVECWLVAFTVDGAPGQPSTAAGWIASLALFGLFAVVHYGMGQPDFRRLWGSMVPPPLQRSLHVLVSCVLLMLFFLHWSPLPFVVWDLGVNLPAFLVEMLSYAGWALALAATSQLDHLEHFGLRQALDHVRDEETAPPEFREPPLYRLVRHPFYLGLLVAVWSTPRMTLGHLLFAGLVTSYLRFLARSEEETLVRLHLEYGEYQARVPMFNPFRRRGTVRRQPPPRRYRRAS